MLPPDDHALLRKIPEGDRTTPRQLISVTIDGVPVLEDFVRLHPIRSRLFFGESPGIDAFGHVFTGRISKIERPLLKDLGFPPQWNRDAFGPIAIELTLGSDDTGFNYPFASLGDRPRGGLLVLECLGDSRVRLQWQGYDGRSKTSEAILWPAGQPHRLEFSLGPLFPAASSSLWRADVSPETKETLKRTLRCTRDGEEIWRTDLEIPDMPPTAIRMGENPFVHPNVQPSLKAPHRLLPRAPW